MIFTNKKRFCKPVQQYMEFKKKTYKVLTIFKRYVDDCKADELK